MFQSLFLKVKIRKFAKSVLRMVFKSLETFLEWFQLSDLNEMQRKKMGFYLGLHTRIFGYK